MSKVHITFSIISLELAVHQLP